MEYDYRDQGKYGRYKADEDYFVDTYETDKKRQNQNYSNLLGQKLGDKANMDQYQDPESYSKNTLEMNVSQRDQNEEQIKEKLLPSVHYSEFKNSNYYEEPKTKTHEQLLNERMEKMKASLLQHPPTPSQQTISEQNDSQNGRNFYRHAMGHGTNPINNTQNSDIFGKRLDEHIGDVVIRFYKVQGYKYTLMKQTDKEIKAQFLKNGYQVMNLQIVRDPISGDANGQVTFKARIIANQERLFEHFLKTTMDFVIMAKK
jgi:hypothetical protein